MQIEVLGLFSMIIVISWTKERQLILLIFGNSSLLSYANPI